MKQVLFIFYIFFLSQQGYTQKIVCTAADSSKVLSKLTAIDALELSQLSSGEAVVAIGKTFLETPYVAKTLEIGEKENLVVNLSGLDCTTFVENVLAFYFTAKSETKDFDQFLHQLERIRYQNGTLAGYASRLHYFSEWIRDNEQKGILENITAKIGGKASDKIINFMSTHRDLYPFLSDDTNFEKIKAMEVGLNTKPLYILSQHDLIAKEALVQSGDIIALATAIKGLDVTHTGFAIKAANGRVHLLHASSSGQVEISKLPLVDYLKKINKNIGITVARPY